MTSDDWFSPVPVDTFVELNKVQIADPAPEKCPVSEPVGGLEVRCGPILRLCGSLEDLVNYRASIMLVVAGAEPRITYQVGPSDKSSQGLVEDGEFPRVKYFETGELSFWRFEISLKQTPYEQRVRYSINGQVDAAHLFFVPALSASMNVVSFSCNGFSLATDTSEYKLSLWLDVLRKHATNHYHVMLGGGDQIYCDAIKIHCESLKPWLETSSEHEKRSTEVSPQMQQEFDDYYLNAYLLWFGKGFWKGKNGSTLQTCFPLAMAQIPLVNLFDDHDIIDGFGSYKDKTMGQPVFSAIGNTAYKYYMLFQQQVLVDEPAHLKDPLWILGKKPGAFIKQPSHSIYMRLGKDISVLGLDCRTERRLSEIITELTYKEVFLRVQSELDRSPDTKHLLVMMGVPILYPRLVWLEKLLTLTILRPIRGLAARGILSKGLVNEFDGGVEVLDDLNDHWCLKGHKRERNLLLKNLTDIGARNGVRITILSGDVHLCCFGRLKTKMHHHPHAHLLTDAVAENKDVTDSPENDPRLMFNVVSSAIINAPPPDAMAGLLNRRSKIHHYDRYTDEDVVPIFTSNPDGSERENQQFLNKRNWSDLILVNQSEYKDDIGTSRFPSSKFSHDIKAMEAREVSDRYTKYPLFPESLVATLHVEADGNDPEATTASYEVIIPDLQGKYQLEKTEVKHL